MRIGSFEIMQEIFDFLSGEENEDIPTPDEGLQEWKKQKSEARARMVAMQRQPYDVKKKRSEMRAKEFVSEMQSGCKNFNRLRKENADHLIEKTGEEIRSSFIWGKDKKIIDRNKN